MTLPNFLIFGAPKAGSTTLYHYLNQHPDIFLSAIKEPCYFSYGPEGPVHRDSAHLRRYQNSVKTIGEYQSLFLNAGHATAVGEASVNYLAAEGAAERIHAMLPGVKLVSILRNPVDRAYSAYWMDVRKGFERRPFAETISPNLAVNDPVRRYVDEGFYFAQLSKYFEIFASDQVKVYFLEDLKARPVETVQDIFSFLGVDAGFVPDTSMTHNLGGVPRSDLIDRLLTRKWLKRLIPTALTDSARRAVAGIRQWNRQPTEPLDKESRRRLECIFSEDISRLEQLLGRDLAHWTSTINPPMQASAN